MPSPDSAYRSALDARSRLGQRWIDLLGGSALKAMLVAAVLGLVLAATEVVVAKITFEVFRAFADPNLRFAQQPLLAVLLLLACAGVRSMLAGAVQAASLYVNSEVTQRVRLAAVQRL